MYVVSTTTTTWQYIVKYQLWRLDKSFLQFTFDDGKILILPIASIKSIEQKSNYRTR